MTKIKFIEYVKSFNKKPGTFTEDEIYDIGLKHKSLDNKGDKDWTELANLLGVERDGKVLSGEQLRSKITGLQRSKGELPRNMKVLSEKNVEELSFDEAIDELELQKRELYKQQTKTRDTLNAYRRSMRDEARIEILTTSLDESIKTLTKLPKVEYKSKNKNSAEAVLLLSDLHIGAWCDNSVNKYSSDIARLRVAKVVDDTIKYCTANKVEKLNILNLGDCIHGLIHTSARIEQELDVTEQVALAAEILSTAINDLQAAAPKVTYRSCSDNHARMVANKHDHIEKENFGKLIDTFIKLRLGGSKIEFIDDNLDFGLGFFKLNNGKNCCFMHGHEDRINTVAQDCTEMTGQFIDYVFMGHLHNTKMKTFNRTKVFINGSVMGSDEYAYSKRYSSPAEQTLLIWDGANLLNYTLNLQEVQ